MSYGNNSKYEGNGTLIFFSPTQKNPDGSTTKVSPYFKISKLINGTFEKSEETATYVSGDLFKVDVKERIIKDISNKAANVYLREKESNEAYVLELLFNVASRSLFNGLINLETFDNLNISIYQTKKGYPAYSIKQNDKRIDWKYKLEEIPEPILVGKLKGKDVRDFSPIDDFYEKELNELSVRLGGKVSKPVEKPTEPKDGDVPF